MEPVLHRQQRPVAGRLGQGGRGDATTWRADREGRHVEGVPVSGAVRVRVDVLRSVGRQRGEVGAEVYQVGAGGTGGLGEGEGGGRLLAGQVVVILGVVWPQVAVVQGRQGRRFVAAGLPQELLEPQLEGLADGGDDVLGQTSAALQHVATPAAGAVLGHVGDVVQRVGVAPAGEADVGHLVLVDHSASVQVTELQTDRGDGQLDVGGGGRQTHALAQHPAQLRVRPASVVVGAALTLAHSVDTLLGDVGPGHKTSNINAGWR